MVNSSATLPHPLVVALFFIACLTALHDQFAWLGAAIGLEGPSRAYVPIGLLLILIGGLGAALSSQRAKRRATESRPDSQLFSPFGASGENAARFVWPREIEASTLEKRIIKAETSNIIVTGPSGAGKSTILKQIVVPRLQAKYYECRIIQTYNDFVTDILETLTIATSPELVLQSQRVNKNVRDFLKINHCSVHDALNSVRDKTIAAALWETIEQHLTQTLNSSDTAGGDKILFIFDQIERLILNAKSRVISETKVSLPDREREAASNGYELVLFLRMFRFLRKQKMIRTVFVVRSEYIYNIFELVETLSKDDSDSEKIFQHFLCPGVNLDTSTDAVDEVKRRFDSLTQFRGQWESFREVCQIGSRTLSNTFVIQLFGYLLENFPRDPRVQAILTDKRDRKHILATYFDYVLSDFAMQGRITSDILVSTFYAIAIENRVAGQAISVDRLRALAHVPEGVTDEIVEFLKKWHLLVEENQGGVVAYRIVHEQLSDFIIESEQFELDGRIKDGIRGLSEARVSTAQMTSPKIFHDPLYDLIGSRSIGLIAIWIFNIYGAAFALFPSVCSTAQPYLSWVWLSQDCAVVQPIYWGRFIMESAWVAYIYVLSRAVLVPTATAKSQKWLSASLPTLGASLGILFSTSPVLFLAPLCVVGFCMSLVLIRGALANEYHGKYREECFVWGYRTLFNMVFTALLMALTFIVMLPASEDFWRQVSQSTSLSQWLGRDLLLREVVSGWVFVSNALMLWFLVHIYPDQAGDQQVIRRLVEYDRTRADRIA